MEIVAAPVLVESAIRITGSVAAGDFPSAVFTTEGFSTGQRFVPSPNEPSGGLWANANPPNDETNIANSKTVEILGEGYFILLI